MHTQYLKSLLATAPKWGLPIDSTTSRLGNAGEPYHVTGRFLAKNASLFYQRGPCSCLHSFRIPLYGTVGSIAYTITQTLT